MIASPSIVPRMPAREYHAHPAVSQSILKMDTPAHMRWAMDHESEATEAQELGLLVDHALLTPWDERPAPYTPGTKKAALVDGMIAALQGHRGAWNALGGEAGLSIFANARHLDDKLPEIPVRCRPDGLLPGVVVDLKTAADVSPKGFQKAAHNWGYFFQAAFYLSMARAAGREAHTFLWVCVRNKAPHYVATYFTNEGSDAIRQAREDYEAAISRFYEAQRTGRWRGYGDEPQELELPRYARRHPTA